MRAHVCVCVCVCARACACACATDSECTSPALFSIILCLLILRVTVYRVTEIPCVYRGKTNIDPSYISLVFMIVSLLDALLPSFPQCWVGVAGGPDRSFD